MGQIVQINEFQTNVKGCVKQAVLKHRLSIDKGTLLDFINQF